MSKNKSKAGEVPPKPVEQPKSKDTNQPGSKKEGPKKEKKPFDPDKDKDGIPDAEEIENRKAEDTDEEEFKSVVEVSNDKFRNFEKCKKLLLLSKRIF